MIRVLIADDHAVVRRGLQELLGSVEDIEVIGMAHDGADAVERSLSLNPDVVLMDLSMPVLDGVAATRQIVSAQSTIRVVVLTSFAEERKVHDALAAGAIGYLLKDATPEELIAGVRAASAGNSPLDPKVAGFLLKGRSASAVVPKLSPREVDVLRLVAKGLANKQIARELAISERTVKAHLSSVFQQLEVSDRTQAAIWANEYLADE